MSNLARDLFAPLADVDRDVFGLPPVVAAGLAVLEHATPLWGSQVEWTEFVSGLRAFDDRWGSVAEAASWSLTQLYGVDPIAPRNRLSRMGGAFLACLRAHRVIAVDATAIMMVTRTSARLRVYRGAIDPGAVLAWELTVPAGCRQSKGDKS